MSAQPPTNASFVAIFIDFQMRNAYCADFKTKQYEIMAGRGGVHSIFYLALSFII
jgi:hypothetical protein